MLNEANQILGIVGALAGGLTWLHPGFRRWVRRRVNRLMRRVMPSTNAPAGPVGDFPYSNPGGQSRRLRWAVSIAAVPLVVVASGLAVGLFRADLLHRSTPAIHLPETRAAPVSEAASTAKEPLAPIVEEVIQNPAAYRQRKLVFDGIRFLGDLTKPGPRGHQRLVAHSEGGSAIVDRESGSKGFVFYVTREVGTQMQRTLSARQEYLARITCTIEHWKGKVGPFWRAHVHRLEIYGPDRNILRTFSETASSDSALVGSTVSP